MISTHTMSRAPVTISNHPIHPVPFAVGVWRSSWSRSLEFQLKSESGVSSLEISRGGPYTRVRTLLRLPIPPCSRLFRVCRLISSSCYVILPPICPNIARDSPKSSILEPTSSKIAPKLLTKKSYFESTSDLGGFWYHFKRSSVFFVC